VPSSLRLPTFFAGTAPLLIFTFLVPSSSTTSVQFSPRHSRADLGCCWDGPPQRGGVGLLACLLGLGRVSMRSAGALFLRAAGDHFWPVVRVCLPLRRNPRRVLGRAARLSCAAAARATISSAIVTLAFRRNHPPVIITWQSLTGVPNGISAFRPHQCSSFVASPARMGLRRPARHRFSPTIASCSCSILILAAGTLTTGHESGSGVCRSVAPGQALLEDEKSPAARSGSTPPLRKFDGVCDGRMFGGFAARSWPRVRVSSARKSFTFQK